MAKATAIGGVVRRDRLFALLDGAGGRAIWICGPPGGGKTTLASSWIEARGMRCLWYRVQAGDSDLASFFYELGARAGRRSTPLPAFTPEYLGGEVAFARRFVRELAPKRGRPWALVIDDLHQVASPEPLLAAFGEALEELPPWARAILVSREQPPAALARLVANGVIFVLGGEDLALTPAEALAIARAHAPGRTREELERVCSRAAGWAAGVVLLAKSPVDEASRPGEPRALFPYLAGEFLDRVDPETRGILVRAALPPILPARIVNAVCGSERALGILEDLVRRGCFVSRCGREDPVFELHPLVREFLLDRGRAEWPADELRRIESRAAGLLAGVGNVEDAIDLYARAGAWPDVAHLLLLRAPHLAATGRTARLERWLEALPAAVAEREPWLGYWRGICRLGPDPAAARAHLARAWEGFEAGGDARGLHLTFAAAIESFVIEWDDLRGMDAWMDRFRAVASAHLAPPRADFELRSATAMLIASTFGRRRDEASSPREARALEVVRDASLPPAARLAMGSSLVVEYAIVGEGRKAEEVVRLLAPLARAPGTDRLAALGWLSAEAVAWWSTGAPSRADRAARLGLDLARESGVHAWDFHLWQQCTLASFAAGDPAGARAHIETLQTSLAVPRAGHRSSLLEMEALLALHEGDAPRAVRAAQAMARAASQSGVAVAEALASTYLALALVEVGDAAARSQLEALRRDGAAWNALALMLAEMAEAELERRAGNLAAARQRLARGLRVSCEKGIAPDLWFSRRRLGELCALALDSGIETEHVLGMVRRLGLAAPPGCASERWPWSVRVRLFGPVEVSAGGSPLRLEAAAHRRPLDVLAALVTCGERGGTSRAVAGALWPDSEGDLAHHALETAAYRLRRLVGHDIVQHRHGELRLDTGRCWVDALAFEALLARAAACLQRRNAGDALAVAEEAVQLYRGPFLDGREEPWALSARGAYRLRLGRCLGELERFGTDRDALRRLRLCARAADPAMEDRSTPAGAV